MKKIAILLVLMMGLLALAGCSSDNESVMIDYTLTTTVTDEATGDPIEGASISVDGKEETTDANGIAQIDLTYGEYTVNVSADGYGNASAPVQITNSDSSLDIALSEGSSQPGSAPVEPASVDIGLFTDASLNKDIAMNWANWSTAEETSLDFNGNIVKALPTNFVGYDFNPAFDGSSKTTLHLQVWTANHTDLKIKLVDFENDGYGGTNGDTEYEYSASIDSTKTWIQLDIPLTTWSDNMDNFTNLSQMVLTPVGSGTMYIDNIYID